MKERRFDLTTTITIDAEGIDELTVQHLIDEVYTKVSADIKDTRYIGNEQDGWEIEVVEEVLYRFYPSNSWYDPDDYEYSDFSDEYEYKKVIKNFEQENNLDLDFCVTNNFDSMECID